MKKIGKCKTSSTTSWEEIPILVTPEQASYFLGPYVQFFRDAARRGELKCLKKGGKYLFRREDLQEYIESLVK